MQKLSKKQKDEMPYLYGYSSPTLIPGNEGCGRQFINGVLTMVPFKVPFADFIDSDDEIRFCECNEKFAKWNRNEKRNEERRIDDESRCKIPAYLIEVDGVFVEDRLSPRSNRNYLKICPHKDCKSCPFLFDKNHPDNQVDYKRTGNPLSMDFTYEGDDDEEPIEYEDTSAEDTLDYCIRREREEALQIAILSMDKDYQEIFKWLQKGKSYSQIALIMNKPKPTIQSKVKKLISTLQKKVNK